MALEDYPNLKPKRWQKGQSGNPKGGSRRARERTKIAKLDAQSYSYLCNLLLFGKKADLSEIVDSPHDDNIKRWVASIVKEGIRKADAIRLEAILMRLLGKVKDQVEHSVATQIVVTPPLASDTKKKEE